MLRQPPSVILSPAKDLLADWRFASAVQGAESNKILRFAQNDSYTCSERSCFTPTWLPLTLLAGADLRLAGRRRFAVLSQRERGLDLGPSSWRKECRMNSAIWYHILTQC
ncbi:MAG: hypothetical protein Rubg2KO_34950 [Rubricoccaceae bacterium]